MMCPVRACGCLWPRMGKAICRFSTMRSSRSSRRGNGPTYRKPGSTTKIEGRQPRNTRTTRKKRQKCKMPEIIYKDESYKIMGACFEVYKEMGCGFLEPVYQECLEIELASQGIVFRPLPQSR